MTTFGVVIDIPEPLSGSLQSARRLFGDPEALTIPPHITVVAPVTIEPAEMPEVVEHLERIVAGTNPFRVHLRGTATFRPVSPVVFVALAEGISHCEQLERRVRSGPLSIELRFPYHPHVTIAQDVDESDLDRAFRLMADFDEQFTVDHVSLYELEDSGWILTRRLELGR